MIRTFLPAALLPAVLLLSAPALAQTAAAPPRQPVPGQAQPAAPTTGTTLPPAGGAASAVPTVPPLAVRAFTAPVGLIFNSVRPERAADFERLLGYLKDALARSTNPTTQAQARGWKMYKAAEAGPNGTLTYVFVMDPTVVSSDYGMGQILAAAFPDPTELQEIWKLYTTSVIGGGSLVNLTPVEAPAPGTMPAGSTPGTPAPATQPSMLPPRPSPPDADPNTPIAPANP